MRETRKEKRELREPRYKSQETRAKACPDEYRGNKNQETKPLSMNIGEIRTEMGEPRDEKREPRFENLEPRTKACPDEFRRTKMGELRGRTESLES
ncbi:hypothetical protein [Aquiflexum balticum]|nr:hypothetical protein [Aquiflexum balticum]